MRRPPGRREGTDLPLPGERVRGSRRCAAKHAEVDQVPAQQHHVVGVTEEPFIDLALGERLARLKGLAGNPGQELPPLRLVGRIPFDPPETHEAGHSGFGLAFGLLREEVPEDRLGRLQFTAGAAFHQPCLEQGGDGPVPTPAGQPGGRILDAEHNVCVGHPRVVVG